MIIYLTSFSLVCLRTCCDLCPPLFQMDPPTSSSSAAHGEAGADHVHRPTPPTIPMPSGSPRAPGGTGLGWRPWSGGPSGAGTNSHHRGATRSWPSRPAATNTKTPAPPAPHPPTQRRRATFWGSPSHCRRSCAERGRGRRRSSSSSSSTGRCRETGA